ncbi:extracellular solute-binding protein [Natrinema longum]|uniref:Extracellular solute-binding protein n=1 Tax=Natrinema longum TaxID=370324 RepID=A0A8A2U7Z5_9EURY|nr:extracellular solute-binding protein [Natrinema longum]MBZ6494312.1 extracellular solute-binding protein [Natrinema longum]QSW84365.1 extracellular solute-binding protein [Natrinema longum]
MTKEYDSAGRRAFLAGSAALGTAGLAGCTGLIGGEEEDDENVFNQIGSGRAGRDQPGGTPMADLPELEGELHIYSGRNEFLVGTLINSLEDMYDGFEVVGPRYNDSSDLANQIAEEGSGTDADVFFTVDSAALGEIANEGLSRSLSDDVLEMVPQEFRTDQWVGTSGRIRTVPYNTDAFSESDMPTSIDAYTDFEGDLGWAPSYGSCQSFVTAMRLLEGEEATREWLEGVVDAGISAYNNEMAVCQAVADGEIDAGFTNHYYIQRVLEGSPDAPLETVFTDGDAGATFDIAGATVIENTDVPDLAENFVRHLLSAEVQEYFAVETFEYPLIPEGNPVGELPTIPELDVPDLDPSELSDLQPTLDLMRSVEGINV